MKKQSTTKYLKLLGALALGLSAGSAMAGTHFWDFTTDPATGADPLEVYPTGFADSTGTSVYWKASDGNPGGFLGLTWPLGSSSMIMIFPDIDAGKTVTAFKLEADMRVGNPQQNVRAADGFSINFARADDPVFVGHSPNDFATSGAVETGTKTGISIIFDTWQGNTLPDGLDFPAGNDSGGIIIRVDNVTILRQTMPLYSGACTDPTSIQTGPRTVSYWTDASAAGMMPDAAFQIGSYSNLCWQPLSVEVNTNSQVTVVYKGVTILDHFKTDFFPSAGSIVLAGRTGGADENTHFDNMRLTTEAITADTVKPTDPTNLAASTPIGANHVILTWTDSTDDSGRVAYEIERDGVVLTSTLTTNRFEDFPGKANTAYTYRVRAKDVSLNVSGYASVVVTTAADSQVLGTMKIELYKNITGTDVGALTADPEFPNSPDAVNFALGAIAGSPNGLGGWNESFGDNYGLRVVGVLTPVETAQYNFFIRSDDASQFFLNMTGTTTPDPLTATPVVKEDGCCSTFLEPGDATKPDVTTATPVSLTAGTSYGILILMKEGGGGDGVAVGMRKVGDTTPAANVPSISPLLVTGSGDPAGAVINITGQPASKTVIANESTSFSVTDNHTTYYSKNAWYQWLRDGAVIAGASATNYILPVVASTDNAAKFSVIIGVPGLVKTSAVATLTVTADTRKPLISRVGGNETLNAVDVTFSEPVTAPTATTADNYKFDKGLTASAATLVNQFTVRLTTPLQTEAEVYTLTVTNVADNAGNAVGTNNTYTWKSWSLVPGRAKMEVWDNIGGTALAALYDDPKYALPADRIIYTPGMDTPNNTGDNYGARARGYLIPNDSGNFNFFLRSDDASQMYLSMNSSWPTPNVDPVLLEEFGCCSAFLEPGDAAKPGVTTATPIAITAGTRYPMIAMVKEGGGGDYVQVAMRKVGDTTAAGALLPIRDQMYWFGPDANVLTPAITNIVASSTNSPAAEGVKNAIDGNAQTKYLNFDKLNTGFTVSNALSTVRGIALTSANDAPERDPASFEVWGSVNGTTFTKIGSGTVPAFPDRFIRREFYFANATAYYFYKVVFPTVANAATANSMQIADVELLGFVGGTVGVGPNVPAMSIDTTAGVTKITYTGTLQSSATANGTYTDVTGATSPYTVITTTGSQFYRAKQ